MSLIERAIDKLAAAPADADSLPERAMALAKAQAAKAAEAKAAETKVAEANQSIRVTGSRFAAPPVAAPAATPDSPDPPPVT